MAQSKKAHMRDFLRMSNSNLHPILRRFHDIADYWANFRCRQRVPLCNALVRGELLKSGLRNLSSANQKHRSIVRCEKYFGLRMPYRAHM